MDLTNSISPTPWCRKRLLDLSPVVPDLPAPEVMEKFTILSVTWRNCDRYVALRIASQPEMDNQNTYILYGVSNSPTSFCYDVSTLTLTNILLWLTDPNHVSQRLDTQAGPIPLTPPQTPPLQ